MKPIVIELKLKLKLVAAYNQPLITNKLIAIKLLINELNDWKFNWLIPNTACCNKSEWRLY